MLLTLAIPLLLLCQVEKSESGGYFLLKTVSFENPGGVDDWNKPCDYWTWDDCDYIFTFCIDKINSGDRTEAVGSCKFGYRESLTYTQEKHKFDFPETSWAGISHPMDFSIMYTVPKIPEAFAIKIKIMDEDTNIGRDDLIDLIRLEVVMKDMFWEPGDWKEFTIANHTFFEIEVSYECSPHYYSKYCNVSCPEPQAHEHYDCNPHNGRKICDEGWFGPTCAETELGVDLPSMAAGPKVADKGDQMNEISKPHRRSRSRHNRPIY